MYHISLDDMAEVLGLLGVSKEHDGSGDIVTAGDDCFVGVTTGVLGLIGDNSTADQCSDGVLVSTDKDE